MKTIVSILSDITKFMNGADPDWSQTINDTEGGKLWSILTALRGPDKDDGLGMLKAATTAVIRHRIGLAKNNYGGAIVNPDSEAYAQYRQTQARDDGTSHFITHAQLAFEALGLKWDELN